MAAGGWRARNLEIISLYGFAFHASVGNLSLEYVIKFLRICVIDNTDADRPAVDPAGETETNGNAIDQRVTTPATRGVTSALRRVKPPRRRLLRFAPALAGDSPNRSGCQAPITDGTPSARRRAP